MFNIILLNRYTAYRKLKFFEKYELKYVAKIKKKKSIKTF